jgi:hypothetical protein
VNREGLLAHQGGADAQAAGGVVRAAVDREELGGFVLGGGEVQGVVRLLPAEGTGDIEGAVIDRRSVNEPHRQLNYDLNEGPSAGFVDLLIVNVSCEDGCALSKQQVGRKQVVSVRDAVPARETSRGS